MESDLTQITSNFTIIQKLLTFTIGRQRISIKVGCIKQLRVYKKKHWHYIVIIAIRYSNILVPACIPTHLTSDDFSSISWNSNIIHRQYGWSQTYFFQIMQVVVTRLMHMKASTIILNELSSFYFYMVGW